MSTSNLKRTTIRILPIQQAWIEKKAIANQRAFAEVLRDCIDKAMCLTEHKNVGTYASNTVPKAVYLGSRQLSSISTFCEANGGTMSALIRHAIDLSMRENDEQVC